MQGIAKRPAPSWSQSSATPVKTKRVKKTRAKNGRKGLNYTDCWPPWYHDLHGSMCWMEELVGSWIDSDSDYSSEDQRPKEDQESEDHQGPEGHQGPEEDQKPVKSHDSSENIPAGDVARDCDGLQPLGGADLDPEFRDKLNMMANDQRINDSSDPFMERQLVLAESATMIVSKAFDILERTPDKHRRIVWLSNLYDLYCVEHAKLFAPHDEGGEYELGDTKTIRIIRVPEDTLDDSNLASISGQRGCFIYQADIGICGGVRATKLFSFTFGSTKPVMVDTLTMGVLAFTFIDDHYFKLKVPRELVLHETDIDPKKAPEFFEFVGISRNWRPGPF